MKVGQKRQSVTFLSEFHANLSRYKEKQLHCASYKKTPPFRRRFAPLWATTPKF